MPEEGCLSITHVSSTNYVTEEVMVGEDLHIGAFDSDEG